MKTVLGLDLGTTSIGWALIHEGQSIGEKSKIIKMGVRVNPLSTEELADFEKGNPLSVNAERTIKRGARRNLQRFKQRRSNLISILKEQKIITSQTALNEDGKGTTHQTIWLRAKAAQEKVTLEDFARVLLSINKKRGYKCSRKTHKEEEGVAVDGMAIAKELYHQELTPGQYVYRLLQESKKFIPDFYPSDLHAEFDRIWRVQKSFYPHLLTETLYSHLQGRHKGATWKICEEIFDLKGVRFEGTQKQQRLKKYKLREQGLKDQLELEYLAVVLQEINHDIKNSSGYLGAISDRSKELYFNNETVGQYLYRQIQENPHITLKGQVFYRQDYLDEFEKIWGVQAQYYPAVLTNDLKELIRDVVIFYQRRLKSQKHLISNCQFEKQHKAIPKSSLLYQEFKVWQNINNLVIVKAGQKKSDEEQNQYVLNLEERRILFEELNLKGDLKKKEVLKTLKLNPQMWQCNIDKIEGNRTNAALYNVYRKIAVKEGYDSDWSAKGALEIKSELKVVFDRAGISTKLLNFDAHKKGNAFCQQKAFELWHLLYSAEDEGHISEEDKLIYGNNCVALKKKLHANFGFEPEYANWLIHVRWAEDYGSLSARAIKKLLPYMESGVGFSYGCQMQGYKKPQQLSKSEIESKIFKSRLSLLSKNNLRNPVVEKILNQLVNVVNQVIETYGKPDEVRIELARELKKSAKERKEDAVYVGKRTRENNDIRKVISEEFNIPNPTKNDVDRYRLYQELKGLGYHTVFTNAFISKEKLFSKDVDIEHIIPKALIFDDSFSNKTLALRKENVKKRDRTAVDFIKEDYNSELNKYQERVETLYDKGKGISKSKYEKLLLTQKNIPKDFVERDLRNSQYIAKKAKAMLLEVFDTVVTTSAKITGKLRQDWDLMNLTKEINLEKYYALGLTETLQRKEGKEFLVIKHWTKKNDQRYQAVDALAVAFTKPEYIQYLNQLSVRKDEANRNQTAILNIERKYTHKNERNKRVFISPIPKLREEAKKQLLSVLVSFKAKNKVATKNRNKIKLKGRDKYLVKEALTPRGQLHKETIYGKSTQAMKKPVVLSKKITLERIQNIIHPEIKKIVLEHLAEYNFDIPLAFDVKTLNKAPLFYNGQIIKEVYCYESVYTIRKNISPDLKIEKVVDVNIRKILNKRLEQYNNNTAAAFSDLDKNPIWLNKEKGICIKKVTIKGVNNVDALREKRDHFGHLILDAKGRSIETDFVSTGNNHHVAIYRDNNGKLQECVVSFFEAIQRNISGNPVIDKNYNQHLGWQFLFTLKQNEMFVFPSDDFYPKEINLLDEKNYAYISKHLFRVQKFSTKDYTFRHHAESTIENKKETKQTTWIRTSCSKLEGVVKVRVNHLGHIVQIGEY